MGPFLQERERDGYAGPQRVASNKRSSLLTVNASRSLRKLKFWEPSLHLSNSLIKQPVDIDVYYDAKTKNRNTNQRKTGLVDMDYVTAKHYSKVTILEKKQHDTVRMSRHQNIIPMNQIQDLRQVN